MPNRKPPPSPRFEPYLPDEARPEDHYGPAHDPYRLEPEPRELAYHGPPGPRPQPRRKRPPPRGGSRLLTGLFYGVLALFALAGGAAAFLIMSLPTDAVRNRIVAEVKARTGRDLVIAGPTSFTFYPTLGVALAGVSLSAAPGMSAKPLVTMAGLDVSVSLLPLLKREVKVKRLILREPRFSLEIDGEGRTSWDFAALSARPEPPRRIRVAEVRSTQLSGAVAPAAAPGSRDGTLARLEDLELADVRIEDGSLHYADARSGVVHDMEAINAALALESIASPLDAEGRLVWRTKTVGFDLRLTSLKAALEDRPVKLALAITSADVEAAFDGTASFKDTLDAEGMVRGQAPSARSLAKWLGAELGPSKGFGPLSATALIRANSKAIALSNAEIALDGATARGQLTIETGGERPLVKANLKVSELDLNTYTRSGMRSGARSATTSGAALPASPSPAPVAATPDTPAAKGPAETIDDLLERDTSSPGPKVKGLAARSGWNQEPIDLSLLGLVDADAKLSVAGLMWREIKTGPAKLALALENRIMKATFHDVALYEGHGRGSVTMDATAPNAGSVGANMTLEGISALPFLKDAAALDWLSGKGRLAFALAGKGQNEHEIIETLNGKVDFTFTDGAIVGINIPQMVRAMSEGRLADLKTAPAEKTDFSEFAATWTVSGGIAQNQDLRLTSPLLRVTGQGRVMLPPREIDYLLLPKLVADLAGQGGEQSLSGLEVPVRVEGSWERPKFKADLETVLKDPNKAVDTIKEIGKKFKGKKAGEILKDLFGSKSGDGSAPQGNDAAGGN